MPFMLMLIPLLAGKGTTVAASAQEQTNAA